MENVIESFGITFLFLSKLLEDVFYPLDFKNGVCVNLKMIFSCQRSKSFPRFWYLILKVETLNSDKKRRCKSSETGC